MIKRNIPNLLTSLNLVCGFIAIIMSFQAAWLPYAPYLIFAAVIFDFCDGLAARSLKAYSELGKQLDSLSDMVSFGVAPGILVFQLFQLSFINDMIFDKQLMILAILLSALIPVFSALRLAKFNIDSRQTSSFIGLPTPASAILIASITLVYFASSERWIQDIILSKTALSLLVIIDSYLMVAEIPMFSFKFKSLSLKENGLQFVFIGIAAALLIILKLYAVPVIIVLYVIVSIFNNILKFKKA
jgi:CDP-diacylglycerol---serine O-phosphatidyltransferase